MAKNRAAAAEKLAGCWPRGAEGRYPTWCEPRQRGLGPESRSAAKADGNQKRELSQLGDGERVSRVSEASSFGGREATRPLRWGRGPGSDGVVMAGGCEDR